MGMRPGEARALGVADFQLDKSGQGRLTVSKAAKGSRVGAPIGSTKTGAVRRIPITPRLSAWIAEHVERRGRLTGKPLFVNPATGTPWGHSALRRTWAAARSRVGVDGVCLYEGTKHSYATDAIRRGVPERLVQDMLGHRDAGSTRRYAVLAADALVYALSPRPPARDGEGLSPACSSRILENKKPSKIRGLMVEAAGIEPASASPRSPADRHAPFRALASGLQEKMKRLARLQGAMAE